MPKVNPNLLFKAFRNYSYGQYQIANPFYQEGFRTLAGITSKQWAKYKQTGTLKVMNRTARRIAVIATSNSEHHHALLKAVDARYGDDES